MKNKEYYEEPKIEVVVFEAENVITTSGGSNPEKDIELEEIEDR